MAGACINVAQSNEFQSVWDGQAPADFATDLAALASAYGAVQAKSAQADAAAAEAALEDAAYILTRALANHFRKTGDLERRGKVDFTRSEIKQLRAQDLAARAGLHPRHRHRIPRRTCRRSQRHHPGPPRLAHRRARRLHPAHEPPPRPNRQPQHPPQRNRNRHRRPPRPNRHLDDLVIQFEDTTPGTRFATAWRQARSIIDAGSGPATGPAPITPVT